ncbi:MAG: CoA activase [bacterium]|nr:MAG: CoA activase [bacterium]
METDDKATSRSLGICLGASTLSIVERVNGDLSISRRTHGGQVGDTVQELINASVPARIGITGRKFRDLINLETISEPEAVELAYQSIRSKYPGVESILSAGSESFLLYTLDSRGKIKSVYTGNKCAAGTGEFFLQQLKRMNLEVTDAVDIARDSEPYGIAHRCSVFSKSDCTHALNKGVGRDRVTAGLCRMMAVKMLELLKSSKAKSTMVVGGISKNPVVMKHLRELFPDTIIPEEAPYFEALGAMLWAEQNGPTTEPRGDLIRQSYNPFSTLPALERGVARVTFKESGRGDFYDGEYVIGLDVGSTTTKAVLVRRDNQAIVASEYLRTLGDPVGASRKCYEALVKQLPEGHEPAIVGLGATGSGRRLAGLHSLTDNVINEIIAHAVAAVYYDPEVETIFEIGGQDAKYTFITNMVPTDYAMNEACSAGTGSFLEEAALESFGIDTLQIADIAAQSAAPLNFNDQCAAFIGSDIKTAIQMGTSREDSVAGLIYSVCMNYLNRVKGNRSVGQKIFMQGGVCYNRAVPLAMSILCDQEIVVPPEPGLMGAFGAALVVLDRLEKGLTEKQAFDLGALASREIVKGKPFTCAGGREKCDRKCHIERYVIDGVTYPFGGICDMYYNMKHRTERTDEEFDLVRVREELVYGYPGQDASGEAKSVGIPTSLYTATAFPLYRHFFTNLGVRVVPSEKMDPEGMEAAASPFCLPVLQSHGFLQNLLGMETDFIFVPHVRYAFAPGDDGVNCTCPLVQGEPYYLNAAFREEIGSRLLSEVLDFNNLPELRASFLRLGRKLGHSRKRSGEAFDRAWLAFQAVQDEMKEHGRRFLASLPPEDTAIVLFGRAYNAFTGVGNMGVPRKFASRGYRIIPYDFLPPEALEGTSVEKMYWASGQGILKAAELVRDTPNLYGVYVTNFSCGPDSFLIERFRNVMGHKPFLTLEFDAHTADAGVDTRVEAFLDVIRGYGQQGLRQGEDSGFQPARIEKSGKTVKLRTGDNRIVDLTDPNVLMLIPSMGELASEFFAATMGYLGIRAKAFPAPGPQEMALGKTVTSCKECLPFLLTTGSLLKFLREHDGEDDVLVYFMPETSGPCRLGQYNVAISELIDKRRIPNLAVLSLTSENGYAGMPEEFTARAVLGMIIADGLDDVRAGILALAEDVPGALQALEGTCDRMKRSLQSLSSEEVVAQLEEEMAALSAFRTRNPITDAVKITLGGEIYVRKDDYSRQHLVEKLAEKGVVVQTAPIYEWFKYNMMCVATGESHGATFRERINARIKSHFLDRAEGRIHGILRRSGFFDGHRIDMRFLLERGSSLINPKLTGEAILTVSGTLKEIGDDTHGVITIGPFGCMPCRIAESILNHRVHDEKANFSAKNKDFWIRHGDSLSLPYLHIETDGNAFPQMVEARIESFVLSAQRLKEELAERKGSGPGERGRS